MWKCYFFINFGGNHREYHMKFWFFAPLWSCFSTLLRSQYHPLFRILTFSLIHFFPTFLISLSLCISFTNHSKTKGDYLRHFEHNHQLELREAKFGCRVCHLAPSWKAVTVNERNLKLCHFLWNGWNSITLRPPSTNMYCKPWKRFCVFVSWWKSAHFSLWNTVKTLSF